MSKLKKTKKLKYIPLFSRIIFTRVWANDGQSNVFFGVFYFTIIYRF